MSDGGQDHLSNELSVDASLTETGISGRVKSRAAAALDRLVGSALDIPAAKWESIARRIRAQSNQETRLIASETTATENVIENDEDLANRIAGHHLSSRIKYVSNKRNIARLAIEHLSKEKIHEEVDTEEINIEDDWLNYFEQYAEKASSERMQDLWARVLAGEIRKPQSFSLVTLRFLAELDKEIATLFEEVTEHRLKDGVILKPGSEQLKGEVLFRYSFLEEVGLLQDVTTGLLRPLTPQEGVVNLREGNVLLRAGIESEIKLDIIRITRIGREITNILPPTDKISVLEQIAEKIEDKVKWLEIHEIVQDNKDGTGYLSLIKTIKSEDD